MSDDLTPSQARNLMENTIGQAIRQYEESTGFRVTDVQVVRLHYQGRAFGNVYGINTTVVVP